MNASRPVARPSGPSGGCWPSSAWSRRWPGSSPAVPRRPAVRRQLLPDRRGSLALALATSGILRVRGLFSTPEDGARHTARRSTRSSSCRRRTRCSRSSRARSTCRSRSRRSPQRIARLVPCDRVGLALLTENGQEFQTYTARVHEDERRTRPRPEVVFKIEQTALGSVVRSREPLIINDTHRTARRLPRRQRPAHLRASARR